MSYRVQNDDDEQALPRAALLQQKSTRCSSSPRLIWVLSPAISFTTSLSTRRRTRTFTAEEKMAVLRGAAALLHDDNPLHATFHNNRAIHIRRAATAPPPPPPPPSPRIDDRPNVPLKQKNHLLIARPNHVSPPPAPRPPMPDVLPARPSHSRTSNRRIRSEMRRPPAVTLMARGRHGAVGIEFQRAPRSMVPTARFWLPSCDRSAAPIIHPLVVISRRTNNKLSSPGAWLFGQARRHLLKMASRDEAMIDSSRYRRGPQDVGASSRRSKQLLVPLTITRYHRSGTWRTSWWATAGCHRQRWVR